MPPKLQHTLPENSNISNYTKCDCIGAYARDFLDSVRDIWDRTKKKNTVDQERTICRTTEDRNVRYLRIRDYTAPSSMQNWNNRRKLSWTHNIRKWTVIASIDNLCCRGNRDIWIILCDHSIRDNRVQRLEENYQLNKVFRFAIKIESFERSSEVFKSSWRVTRCDNNRLNFHHRYSSTQKV